MSQTPPFELTDKLLNWFTTQGRTSLPWRGAPCGARDPYQVWLAEIMLQQTTVAAVIPYFETFMSKWPDVKALAAADTDAVMQAWAGLGYYARARNMLKCARAVAGDRQGAFPHSEADLLALPGIGPYTAAAIAAIAFNGDAAPVDGNVIRVLTRLYAISDVMPTNKAVVGGFAAAMLPKDHSGDFAEALMDLGATVCKPKNPKCDACPWTEDCAALAQGDPTAYPRKAPKKIKPTRTGWIYWIERSDGSVLLERRPERGLLGGMMGFPSGEWDERRLSAQDAIAQAPIATDWRALDGVVRHTFTHFHLELRVLKACDNAALAGGAWHARGNLAELGLPTVMHKVRKLVNALV